MAVCKDCGGRAPMLSDLCNDCSGKREMAIRDDRAREQAAIVTAQREAKERLLRLPPNGQPWSYHVVKFSPTGVIFRGGNIDIAALAGELNQMGAAGWEVVGVITSAIAQGATNEVGIILKRPA